MKDDSVVVVVVDDLWTTPHVNSCVSVDLVMQYLPAQKRAVLLGRGQGLQDAHGTTSAEQVYRLRYTCVVTCSILYYSFSLF